MVSARQIAGRFPERDSEERQHCARSKVWVKCDIFCAVAMSKAEVQMTTCRVYIDQPSKNIHARKLRIRRGQRGAPEGYELDATHPMLRRPVHIVQRMIIRLRHARAQLRRRKRGHNALKAFGDLVHVRACGRVRLRHVVDERAKELEAEFLGADDLAGLLVVKALSQRQLMKETR